MLGNRPLFVLLLLCFITLSQSELRFCHNGPHRMQDDDCPGGLVFKTAVTPTCKYFAKTSGTKELMLTAPTDVCRGESLRVIEGSGDDLQDMDAFTWFMWEDDDSGNATGNDGQFDPETICQDECLPEWVDKDAVADEEAIPDDFDKSKVSAEDQEFSRIVNKKLFMKLLMDDPEEEDKQNKASTTTGSSSSSASPSQASKSQEMNSLASSLVHTVQHDTTKTNLIKLLAKSMKIAIAACSPFVKEDFYEQVLKGMIFISKMFEAQIVDVGPDLYKGIVSMLDHCGLRRHQQFHLNGSRCEGMEKVDGIYYSRSQQYWPYRLTGRSFRWGKYHPLLDAAWTTIDFIHSFCFESFLSNMMLGHVYEVAMEGLFSRNVSLLWRVEQGVKNDKFWNNVMQTMDLNITMRNLDACAIAARIHSPFKNSLPRPFLTNEQLKRPPPAPPASIIVKGWNKTIEKYWEHYEKQGGFKKVSAEFGKCFQEAHSDETEEMIDTLKTDKPC